MKHTVVVVDDHTLLSQAICGLVDSFNNFKTLYTCKNGEELLERFRFNKDIPEIVLMDVNMPRLNGIQTTQALNDNYPDVKVLALSVEESEQTILDMIRAGAKGYLMKDIEQRELEKALQELVVNGMYHTNAVSTTLINAVNDDSPTSGLKEREIEFIKLACTEMNYKEIAQTMFLSPKTVEGYRDSVYQKLKVKNRIGLALYAIKHEIFTP